MLTSLADNAVMQKGNLIFLGKHNIDLPSLYDI